jgi:nicotinamidase-related amidase
MRKPKNARGTALLIIDLVSDFNFPDGRSVLRAALPVAIRIAALRARAKAVGIPNIFVNDNMGQWKSDFRQMLTQCSRPSCRGAAIVKLLKPDADDYYVLKPTHAGFYGTPLDRLLDELKIRSLILTGISAHQCILFTANEAYLRDYKLRIPRDCVASKTDRQHRFAIEYFKTVLHAQTQSSGASKKRGM